MFHPFKQFVSHILLSNNFLFGSSVNLKNFYIDFLVICNLDYSDIWYFIEHFLSAWIHNHFFSVILILKCCQQVLLECSSFFNTYTQFSVNLFVFYNFENCFL